MNRSFLKYKFSYLLGILSLISTASMAQASAHIIIGEFSGLVQAIVRNLQTFLSKNDNKTYAAHMKIFDQTIEKHPLTFRSGLHSDLEKKADNIVQKFKKPFIEVRRVLKEYEDRKRDGARNLIKDLRKVLPIKQLLPALRTRLLALKQQARAENDIKLVKTIKWFIAYIDSEKKAWEKRSQFELFGVLCRRMDSPRNEKATSPIRQKTY